MKTKEEKILIKIEKLRNKQEKLFQKLGWRLLENPPKVYDSGYEEEIDNAIKRKDVEGFKKALNDNFKRRLNDEFKKQCIDFEKWVNQPRD